MKRLTHNHASVIGSGPNGMAAAITLARAGIPVTVYEKNIVAGGACRSEELLSPGCLHDIGSSVHPLAVHSPFFRTLALEDHGLNWITPEVSLAHPFDDGSAAILTQAIAGSAETFDMKDRQAYQNLMTPLVRQGETLIDEVTSFPKKFFQHPFLMARFGLLALSSTKSLVETRFGGMRARALFAGLGVHSVMDQETRGSIAAGLILGAAAHLNGWAFPKGGAQGLTNALISKLAEHGGSVITSKTIHSLEELAHTDLILMDTSPQWFLERFRDQLSDAYKSKLQHYRYGPGVFKVDWLLSGPVPWKAEGCRKAGTVHLGGTHAEIIMAEKEVFQGAHPDKPFVLLAQPSLFDASRTPDQRHVLWGYCHVPAGSIEDMTERIEEQIERFAPGFSECILQRTVMNTRTIQNDNPNCIRGDITGGSQNLKRLLVPPLSARTPVDNAYFCSSVVPPGPGVHGMCGYHAASSALRDLGIG